MAFQSLFRLSPGCAELVGAIMGDGNIYTKNHKYRVGLTGNPISDKAYYTYIQRLILVGFRVANIWSYSSPLSNKPAYKVGMNGLANVHLWMNKIGFSNPSKRSCALEALQIGYKK